MLIGNYYNRESLSALAQLLLPRGSNRLPALPRYASVNFTSHCSEEHCESQSIRRVKLYQLSFLICESHRECVDTWIFTLINSRNSSQLLSYFICPLHNRNNFHYIRFLSCILPMVCVQRCSNVYVCISNYFHWVILPYRSACDHDVSSSCCLVEVYLIHISSHSRYLWNCYICLVERSIIQQVHFICPKLSRCTSSNQKRSSITTSRRL